MKEDNVALIGFMGVGKTSVALQLSKRLGKGYISTDNLVVKKAGKPISRIFEEDGEIRFRELEIEAVKEAASMRNMVIDCGGGVVLNWINVEYLKRSSTIILLKARPEIILKRISKCKEVRPLLKDLRLENLVRLLKFREPFYERAADYAIDSSNLSIGKVVDEVIKLYESSSYEKQR